MRTPVACMASERVSDVVVDGIETVGSIGVHLSNSEAMQNLAQHLKHLSATQQADIVALIADYPELFQDVPGCTSVAVHDVDIGSTLPIKQHPYILDPVKLKRVEEER